MNQNSTFPGIQPLEDNDAIRDLSSNNLSNHLSKLSLNGGVAGFSHGAFHSNKPSTGGFRDRLNGGLPAINTSRDKNSGMPGVAELQTPATGYDMNFTPLLPSQLLMGSPFQPGSPSTFTSPQFQSFPTFTTMNGQQSQSQAQNMGSPIQSQQQMSPQFQNMYPSTGMGTAQFYGTGQMQQMQQMQGMGYGTMQNSYANPMNMAPGLGSSTSRTVYLGNIPPDTSAEEILGHVRSGQIESVRLLPDRNCAFISFLDGSSAVHFHSDAILKKLSIRGQDIKIGWGKPSHIPSTVALAVQQSGASRNVYLGNLPPELTEEEIREDLGVFGTIDTIKLVREKNIGFVHYLTISSAIKAVSQLPQDPKWQPPRRVFYGKDRCAYVSKTQQQNAAQYLGIPSGYAQVLSSTDRDIITNALAQQSVAAAAVATAAGGANNLGNRTVYLGNIHPETSMEEICNVVRGGLLHHIRYIPDKHICFVTFIDPTAAASFFALSNMQGLMIHNRRLKIGWGKHSQALPPAIALAVSGGASRNVYIGNIDESWTEERLRQDFSEYGEIELVNALREKSCAFVNFTNIANAIKAIEQVRGREEYKRFKINFGKDRCGNPPRQVHQQNHQNNQDHYQQLQNGQQSSQDGVNSPPPPTVNGNGHHGRSSQSPLDSASSRHPGSDSHSNQGPNGAARDGINANPLHMYLNHVSSNQQQQQQQQQQPPANQQLGGFDHLSPSYPSMLSSNPRNADAARHQQPHNAFHGQSNSFSINADDYGNNGMTTIGGLLAPNVRNAQHSRAISLPVFGQYAAYNGQQQAHQSNNFGFGMNHIQNGSTGFGYGLAIHNDVGLPRWAEEEIAT